MTGKLLAHSARPNRGIPGQPFWEHIQEVERAASANVASASAFWTGDRASFIADVEAAARFHDCGKLAPENQDILAQSSKDPLPVRHEDGGSAHLINQQRRRSAMLVASHHAGLPSMPREKTKPFLTPPGAMFRCEKAAEHTKQHLAAYVRQFEQASLPEIPASPVETKWTGLTHRIALSCLVDADHTDTARHYADALPAKPAECRWDERARALDEYVRRLAAERVSDPRAQDRRDVYLQCRDSSVHANVVSCDATVGSGKTTAVMARLLRTAGDAKLRHIFVVLPFTTIIQQSVDVYRKALTLPGEDATEVVAEVHHRAEFQHPELREMSVLWDAPITVLTAVQFFETLAGHKPSRLRKLHELPGSAVFIDEAHASIPISLWPQTWLWLKELASDWGCHFVLASGSLARFWENREIVDPPEAVPDLLPVGLRAQLQSAEERRIKIEHHPGTLNCVELSNFVLEKDGPRLVILNTVQSAAVLANSLKKLGRDVLHLSTALAPQDRETIVHRIRERLRHRDFTDWTLVATSCVEAGVDFSFRTAIRESCSVASLIQAGGRVNRHGEWSGSHAWDVTLQDPHFNHHPGFESSRRVLSEMLKNGEIGPDTSKAVTEALRRELVLRDVSEKAGEIKKAEYRQDFPEVSELYKVIDSDTQTVVVDPQIVKLLEDGNRLPWRDLIRGSVQIWRRKTIDLAVKHLDWHDDLYVWTGPYDPEFLGYMAGVLPLIHGKDTGIFG